MALSDSNLSLLARAERLRIAIAKAARKRDEKIARADNDCENQVTMLREEAGEDVCRICDAATAVIEEAAQ